jgi:uncharacterized protein (TIGR03067 family)
MTNEIDSMQGTWQVVALETDGQSMAQPMLAEARVVVSGDRFTSLGMGAIYGGTLVVDPGATPRRLDLVFDSGPEHGNTNLAIYELDGDTWRICLSTTADRPTRIAADPGSGCALETLSRISDPTEAPDAPSAEPASAERSPSKEAPSTELEGEWTMVSGMLDGRPVDRRMLTAGRRMTRGDETTVLFGTQVFMRMTFTLNPERRPRAIDYLNLQGGSKGRTQQGIYELDRGTLRLCVAPPGADRPADFTTAPGDGRLLTVWTLA